MCAINIFFKLVFLNHAVVGNLLLKRLLVAIPQAIRTHNEFVTLNVSLRSENPEELAAMEQALVAWEADKTQPDPYRLPKSSMFRLSLLVKHIIDIVRQT